MLEYLKKNCIFSDKILNFIFSNTEAEKIYTHYTHNESVAKQILEEGFKYEETFYKTTQNIQNEPVVLNYKHSLYEHFGEYLLIFSIPEELIDYIKKNFNISKYNMSVEDFISKEYKENKKKEVLYTLPAIFVKGYIKYKTDEIIKNPKFLLNFQLNEFVKKL